MKILVVLFSALLISTFSQGLPPQNPVIGIYTQTYDEDPQNLKSFISASYVKFIEMSGAQVVPIYSFADMKDVLALLGKINGVLFPGGEMPFDDSQWIRNADAIFKYAKQQNDKGNQYPIFGTCMGHQLLAYLSSNLNGTVLTQVHGDQHIILPITFVNQGYIFATYNSNQIEKVTKGHGLFYFNHQLAVLLETHNSNSLLKNFWTVISTTTTPRNQKFVSSWQAKKYPFFSVQFHPEKNLFEWKVYADRSLEGVEVAQIISNRFIDVARKNSNRFASAEQFTKLSIYNFKTQPTTWNFTEVYVFNQIPRMQKMDLRFE